MAVNQFGDEVVSAAAPAPAVNQFGDPVVGGQQVMVTPGGKLVQMDSATVQQALSEGYRMASPEELRKHQWEKDYGGPGSKAVAALEGVGRGVLGPLAPALERAAGVDPEGMLARAEVNPVTAGVGEGVGFVGSMFLPGVGEANVASKGVGVAAKAAEVAAKAAEVAGKAALLPKVVGLAEKGGATLAHALAPARVLDSGAKLAAKGALEGFAKGAAGTAAFVASDEASRYVMGDPEAFGEGTLGRIGIGALLGGAIAAPFGALGSKQVEGKLSEWLDEQAIMHAKNATGATGAQIKRAFKYIPEKDRAELVRQWLSPRTAADEAGNVVTRGPLISPFKSYSELADAASKEASEAGQAMGKFIDDAHIESMRRQQKGVIDDLMGGAFDEPGRVRPSSTAALEVDPAKLLAEIKAHPNLRNLGVGMPDVADPTQIAARDQVERILTGYEEKFGLRGTAGRVGFGAEAAPAEGAMPLGPLELNEMQQQLGAAARGWKGVQDPAANAAREALDAARFVVKERLETYMEALTKVIDKQGGMTPTSLPDLARKLGILNPEKATSLKDIWQGLKMRWRSANLLEELADHGLARADANSPLGLFGAIFATGAGAAAFSGTGSIMKAAETAGIIGAGTHFIRKSMPGIQAWGFNKLAGMSEAIDNGIVAGVRALVKGTKTAVVAQAAEQYRVTPKNFEKHSAEVNALVNDPARLDLHLKGTTAPWYIHMPEHGMKFHQKASKAVIHLGSVMPQMEQNNPLDSKLMPSKTEMAAYNRHVEVVNNPLVVLEHASKGTLREEHLAALQAVYPKLAETIKTQVASQVAEAVAKGQTIPREARNRLSVLLGYPLTQSLRGETIAANQAIFAAAVPQAGQQEGPKPKAISLGERSMTGSQSNQTQSSELGA